MDKRNKIRYLNMNQDKLEKKLLQEFEKNQTNRPKIPREGQNPYQHLTTFNNLIGYFVEKTSPYDNLFTWTQHHQKFTKFNIPYQFENEYKEGGNKYYTCNKIKNQEDFNNGMTGCFEGVDLVGINNVSDLVINNKFIENIRKNTEISKIIDDDSNLSINKNKKKKSSILEKKNTNLNKIPIIIQTPRINTEGNIDKTKTMIRQHAKNLILSEGLIKHRKIFNLNKLKENQLNLDLFKTSRKKNKTEGDFFNNNKNKIGKNLFLNPFDMKNYSINKILSNANDQSLNTFMQQRIKNLKKLKIKQKKKNLNIAINLSINTNNNSPTQMKSSKKFSNVNDESSDLKSKNSKKKEENQTNTNKFRLTKPKLKFKTTKHNLNKSKDFADSEIPSIYMDNLVQKFDKIYNFENKQEKSFYFQEKDPYKLTPYLNKYNSLNDDNIFNYNSYFKKRYYNNGMRLDLSEKAKNSILDFEKRIQQSCITLTN